MFSVLGIWAFGLGVVGCLCGRALICLFIYKSLETLLSRGVEEMPTPLPHCAPPAASLECQESLGDETGQMARRFKTGPQRLKTSTGFLEVTQQMYLHMFSPQMIPCLVEMKITWSRTRKMNSSLGFLLDPVSFVLPERSHLRPEQPDAGVLVSVSWQKKNQFVPLNSLAKIYFGCYEGHLICVCFGKSPSCSSM